MTLQKSELLSSEGIAGFDGSAVEAALEPHLALLGGAVGKALGAHFPARHSLDTVVADGSGGVQGSRNIVFVDELALFGRVSPDAGLAVGL